MRTSPAATLAGLLLCASAQAADFVVQGGMTADEKAVFATVEPTATVPARVRTGGTIASLAVHRGEAVTQGQLIATVGDPKLALQQIGLNADIEGLRAQLAQTKVDLQRVETLVLTGAAPRAQRDQLRTQVEIQQNAIEARTAQLQVVAQQLTEGQILAPTAGRVLALPFTQGTVVNGGETVASIAVSDYVLRLRVPEEHARFLRPGDPIRVDAETLPGGGASTGTITLIYPQIEDGRVIANARVAGLGDYFVGERVRVWVSGGERRRIVVPEHLLLTRFGLDYARLDGAAGIVEVPVQRGQPAPTPDIPDGIEILSGLAAGDRLAAP